MSRKEKKSRKIFNLYNFAVLMCLLVIFGALFMMFEQDSDVLPDNIKEKYADIKQNVIAKFEEWTSEKENNTTNNTNTNTNMTNNKNNTNSNNTNSNRNNTNTNTNSGSNTNISGNTSEQAARAVAVAKFHELGEAGITESDLEIMKIQRQGEDYYYIASNENTLEIKVDTGKITRINSIPVE